MIANELDKKTGDLYGIMGTVFTILKYLAIPVSVGAAWALLQGDVKFVKANDFKQEVKIEEHEKRLNVYETEAKIRFANIEKKIDETGGDIKEILRRMPRRGDNQ